MKGKARTFLVFLITLIFCTGALFAAGGQESPPSPESGAAGVQPAGQGPAAVSLPEPLVLTVGVLKGPSGFGIVRLMEELKSLPQEVSVEYLLAPSPAELVTRIVSGEIQAALLPLNTAAKLYTLGQGYPLAAVPGWGNLYILSRDPEVRSLADLAGKTVYTTGKGATPDFLFRYLAGEEGVDLASVTLDFSFPAAQLAQLAASGRADTVMVPQPFAALVGMKGEGMEVRIDLQAEWARIRGTGENYPMTAFVVSPEFAAGRPEAFRALLDAYRESVAWVLADPSAASLAIERQDILAAGPARAAIPACGLEFRNAVDARGSVEAFLSVLLAMDPQSVGDRLPDDGFYLEP